MDTAFDVNGKIVKEGDQVVVIAIDPGLIQTLPDDERERVNSMLGEQFTVYEINEYGYAMVEKWWQDGPDRSSSHSIALASYEMERVDSAT